MPNIKLIKSSKIANTYRTAFVKSKFDIEKETIEEHFDLDFEFPTDWNVGVIVGSSGTGKSTIANHLFAIDKFDYGEKAIIEEINTTKSVDEICDVFNKVGFSSPQSWLKPYCVLSNGEKMRVDLAQALLSDREIICFDEFTSVVDRQVAKIASHCIAKYVRKHNKRFIAVSCHYDILDWLEPDWVIDTSQMSFQQGKLSPCTEDQKSKSTSSVVTNQTGEFLESIII